MKVYLHNGGMALTKDIHMLERKIGESLDQGFLEFVKNYDGAELESAVFIGEGMTQETSEVSVRAFIPVKDILDEAQWIENLPERSYPVAYNGTGNYIYIKQGFSSGVFFWDHEQPDGLTRLADDFAGFLEGLEPSDDSVIEDMLDKKVKVWINPEFAEFIEAERRKAEQESRQGKQD